MNKLTLSLIFFLFTISGFAQKWAVFYHYNDSSNMSSIEKIFSKTTSKDSVALVNYLEERLSLAYQEGFLELSIDSVVFRKTDFEVDVYVYAGKEYKKFKLRYNVNFEGILRQANSEYLSEDFLDVKSINSENRKITRFLENHGYPFAKVYLDSVSVNESEIFAFLKIERGDRILYDSVSVVGSFKVSKSFLYGYTGVEPSEPYSSKDVENIRKQINDLPFAQQSKETQIVYKNKKLNIDIPANQLSNNRFDGILGILPNDETTGKLVLTGEVNIFLQNMLRSAEELNFKWKKLESSSQELNIDFKIPYIFNTDLGLSSGLDLHKQDSTYINSTLEAGIQFYFQGQNNIGFQYKNKTSAVLTKDTNLIKQLKPMKINSYGLTFNYKKLDYYFNPHKGIDFSVEVNIGNKNIETIKEISRSQVQYDGAYHLKWYLPLGEKHTLVVADQASFLLSETMYTNELYRIGGLNSLRGFMESSIYASTYNIMTLEYRYIFERNSAIFAFFDGAWYEKKLDDYYTDYPFGFGLGLFFKTKAGIFTISYALGQQKNENLNIKNAKIHFGFINKF